jgi:hypothetical protein
VQCDLRRPACGRCLRARIQCSGYERQWVFVNVSQSADSHELAVTRTLPDVTLPISLARSAYEEKYIGLFWDIYLPNGQEFTKLSLRYPVGTWVHAAQALYQSDPALHKVLLALCFGTISWRKDQVWMAQESLRFYVSSLRDLNAGLRNPTRRKSDALMLATRMLSLYEVRPEPEPPGPRYSFDSRFSSYSAVLMKEMGAKSPGPQVGTGTTLVRWLWSCKDPPKCTSTATRTTSSPMDE